jgi:hypothetical protein
MGFATYMNLPVSWEKLLQKQNAKSKQHISILVLAWKDPQVTQQSDGDKILDMMLINSINLYPKGTSKMYDR